MGVGVSSWQLAREVARCGQLGVVSGTALDVTLARRLQDGDRSGDMRRALRSFPDQAMVEEILRKYFRPDGRPEGTPYRPVPRLSVRQSPESQALAVLGNFAEVWLAKDGHDGLVGINYLEKVQMATPSAALGAVLAGVDYVLMGAGLPREIPQLLTDLAAGQPGGVTVQVSGDDDPLRIEADPRLLLGDALPPLRRPRFLAIISATVLASYLARDPSTRPDGYVVEGASAGGHNAPPRGTLTLDDAGEPVYGPRDQVDLAAIAALGLPFWVAGGAGTPDDLAAALAAGAEGVQVGTLFALSRESGLRPDLREELLASLGAGTLHVHTDVRASPTGFPFKVADVPGSVTDPEVYAERPRICDLGYLRTPYRTDAGQVGYRCPAEPVHTYVRKHGEASDTEGRACLCNALMANVGFGQVHKDGYEEPPLLTLGSSLDGVRALQQRYPDGWSAAEAIAWITRTEPAPTSGKS